MRKTHDQALREMTEAQNEIAVLDALAALGTATAKQIADHAGINYMDARFALKRQFGFSVDCKGQTWWLLSEPSEPNGDRRVGGVWEQRGQTLEAYLLLNGIDWIRARCCRHQSWYSIAVSACDIQVGDRIAITNSSSDRFWQVFRIQKKGEVLVFLHGKQQ